MNLIETTNQIGNFYIPSNVSSKVIIHIVSHSIPFFILIF